MENNKGCLIGIPIYLPICIIISFIFIKIRGFTVLDAFLSSLGLVFGLTVLISIIAVPIEKIVTSIKEQGWNIVNTDTFKNIVQFTWYFVAFYIYSKSNEYEKLEKIVEISTIIFIFIFPVLLFSFFESFKLSELERQQKEHDDLKERYKHYEKLLLEHKIIKYEDEGG